MNKMKCLLCNQSDLAVLYKNKKTAVLECRNCGLGITKKTTASSHELYKTKKYYSLAYYKKQIDKQSAKFEYLIEKIRMFINEGKVLDVGGGFGLFSALLSVDKQFNITMLEPNFRPHFLERIKNVNHLKKPFLKFKGRKQQYGLITFLDALEHFKNPVEVLARAHHLLKRKGFVAILLPNYKSAMRYSSENWSWWMLEDHQFHFSRNSMKKLLGQTGFAIVYMDTFESLQDFWLNLQGNASFVRDPSLRKLAKAFLLGPFFGLYLLLRPLVWYLKAGGLLFVIAQKK